MNAYLTVLGIAALPAAANFLGGLLAEFITLPRRALQLTFERVAGMLLAVVGIELMPRVLHSPTPWLMIIIFVLGSGLFLAIEEGTKAIRDKGPAAGSGNPFVLYAAILVDLFVTGVTIGVGINVERGLGLLLALSLLVADAPEGFASIAGLREAGVARTVRLELLAALAISVLLGASVGYLVH